MIIKEDKTIIKRIEKMLKRDMDYKDGNLLPVVECILKKKKKIEKLVSQHKTPLYIFDKEALDDSIDLFTSSFKKEINFFKAYYALKINHHSQIVRRVIEKGMGIDAGSTREIDIAIKSGCTDIIYFSPGKTIDDITYAITHNKVVAINIDSFNELKKINIITKKYKKKIKAGIRIHTDSHGDWKKYGIHIKNLKRFWEESKKCPFVSLEGIHFHMSRNANANFYETTLKKLGSYLKKNFKKSELDEIKFIDFGGGFEIHNSEGYYPHKTSQGSIIETVNSHDNIKTSYKRPYYIRDAIRIEEYAKIIGKAIRKYLNPLINAAYYSEPGRFICNNAMYIILSIIDIKDDRNLILNGGVNMVGWQRFEYEYFPLINISSPSKKELKYNMWGSLCTTWDIWGYYCYAKKFREDDIIVVPNQGALTYSLAQNFIQPIPEVYLL